jgi:hypothetical protein
MQRTAFAFVLVTHLSNLTLAQDAESLVAASNPAIQEQLTRAYNAFLAVPTEDLGANCEAFKELQRLKDITKDKGEIVKELAVFVVTTSSEEDSHVLQAGALLGLLDLPPSIPIRVLAPYLDADNRQLRDFARIWFQYHDSNTHTHGRPPLGSVNYYDYMQYARSRLARNEEIPTAFIEYIYEQHPGKALLVFAYSNRSADVVDRLRAIHEARQATRQGREKTPDEVRQQREWMRQDQISRQQAKREQSEIFLAEHIISDAIWLKENGFPEQFQEASPEAATELAKLANHKEWWARLYVAYVMHQHRELRQGAIVKQLAEDESAIVSKVAKCIQ